MMGVSGWTAFMLGNSSEIFPLSPLQSCHLVDEFAKCTSTVTLPRPRGLSLPPVGAQEPHLSKIF